MAGKGNPKTGGRRRGSVNKVTAKRIEELKEEAAKNGQRQFLTIVREIANQAHNMSKAYAPNRERKEDDKFPPDEAKSNEFMETALRACGVGIGFESPKLASTVLRGPSMDEPQGSPIKFELNIVDSKENDD